jgi:hypothetical protein
MFAYMGLRLGLINLGRENCFRIALYSNPEIELYYNFFLIFIKLFVC